MESYQRFLCFAQTNRTPADGRVSANRERRAVFGFYGLSMAVCARQLWEMANRLLLFRRLAKERFVAANPRDFARSAAKEKRAP